jgi:hypothetical protein
MANTTIQLRCQSGKQPDTQELEKKARELSRWYGKLTLRSKSDSKFNECKFQAGDAPPPPVSFSEMPMEPNYRIYLRRMNSGIGLTERPQEVIGDIEERAHAAGNGGFRM